MMKTGEAQGRDAFGGRRAVAETAGFSSVVLLAQESFAVKHFVRHLKGLFRDQIDVRVVGSPTDIRITSRLKFCSP